MVIAELVFTAPVSVPPLKGKKLFPLVRVRVVPRAEAVVIALPVPSTTTFPILPAPVAESTPFESIYSPLPTLIAPKADEEAIGNIISPLPVEYAITSP